MSGSLLYTPNHARLIIGLSCNGDGVGRELKLRKRLKKPRVILPVSCHLIQTSCRGPGEDCAGYGACLLLEAFLGLCASIA